MKDDVPHDAASIDAGVVGADTLHSQTRLPADSPTPPPIPDYELFRCIGRGSYGEVWLARNVMGEFRAVKIVHRAAFGGDSRPFEREFEGIRKFEPISRSHESQLPILHVGLNEAAGCFYYVMELADDASVAVVVRKLVSDDGKNARPHPGPLPRGEGESSSARRQVEALQNIDRRPIPVPSPGGEGKGEGGPTSQLSTQTSLNYIPRTLRLELERHGRLPLAQCLDIGLALTTALAHLHKHGLVHRDIKPSNIIFVQGRPKLADIGLVTDAGDARSIVGTEGYLAPEGPGSPQADLYSLGKVLYEISTGRDRRHFPDLPLDLQPRTPSSQLNVGSSALNVERSTSNAQHSTVEPRAFPELRSSRREEAQTSKSAIANRKSEITQGLLELNEILLKACARDPRQRYQSAEEMHADLALLQHGQSVIRKHTRAHRLKLASQIGLATAVIALLVASGWLLSATTNRRTNRTVTSHLTAAQTAEVETLCKEGQEFANKQTKDGFTRAVDLFNQAIAIDPDCVPAYLGLADAYRSVSGWHLPPREAIPPARSALLRVLELDPKSVEAHAHLGNIKREYDWDWVGAEQEYQRAIELEPRNPAGHSQYGAFLCWMGRMKEAHAKLAEARPLLPPSHRVSYHVGMFFYFDRQYPEAIAHARNGLALEPNSILNHWLLMDSYLAQKKYSQALDEAYACRALDNTPSIVAYLGYLHAVTGKTNEARQYLANLERDSTTRYVSTYFRGFIYLGLGEKARAMDCLNLAYEERFGWLGSLKVDPLWDDLRTEPRFAALLKQLGLAK